MTAGRLVRTAQAEQDLIEIWQYIARENEAAANRILDRLERKSRLVAARPYLGRPRDSIRPGLRQTLSCNYLILYRILPGGIEVVRYVHASRLLPPLIEDA